MNILILDDDNSICLMVEKLLLEIGVPISVYIANTYDLAQSILAEQRIDVAFLDIEIQGDHSDKNGLVFAGELSNAYPKAKIIFITSYPSYALKSYEVHPFDYVVKPVDPLRLKDSAERAFEEVKRLEHLKQVQLYPIRGERLYIRTNKDMIFLPFNEIIFIEKVGKEVVIHAEKTEISVRWTLAELSDMLPREFVRVHKSFLVNASKINRISEFGDRTYEIFFWNINKTAILSRYKVNDLFEIMNIPFKE